MFGCDSAATDSDKESTIYTSIYPIEYIVEELSGEFVHVESIYPPGVDVHSYEPTSKEITDMAKADAFIFLGAGMEGFATTARDALNDTDVHFVEIGNHEALFDESTDHSDSDTDPHIWLDPEKMVEVAAIVRDELTELYPEEKETILDNFAQLEEDMEELDTTYTNMLEEKENKEILVSHGAYKYWEKYGVKQVPISGLSSSDEPSQKELTKIADLAHEKDIKYVIFEQNSSDRVSTIIQEAIGAEALYIHNLEVLTDEDIEQENNYIDLMEENLKVLDEATN